MSALSKTQLEVLQELRDEGVRLHYMRYAGRFNPTAYWFISNSMKHVRELTINVLIAAGLC